MTNIKTTIWKSLLFIAIFAVTISILVFPFMRFIDKQLLPSISRLGQDIISIIPVLFATFIMIKYFDKASIAIIGLENKNIWLSDYHTLI